MDTKGFSYLFGNDGDSEKSEKVQIQQEVLTFLQYVHFMYI